MSMYADDIAVWSQHKDKLRAQAMVQEAVEAFRNWSSEHRLSLNPSKCEVSFFSTDPAEAKWCPVISLNGQQFAVNKTPTFLGVKYDRTLTFRPQADAVKVRVLGRIRILASLASKDWGWSRNSLKRIYMATIHSVLHYCGSAWQPWLAKSNLMILERVKNRALRCLTGQLADTPLECLRTEADVMSFAATVRKNCLIAWDKSARLHLNNPRRNLFDSPVPHRWKNRSCLSVMSKAECEDIGLDEYSREMFVKWFPPPWSWDPAPAWIVRTSLSGGSTKRSNQASLLADAISTIDNAEHHEYVVYTDCSAHGGITNGGSSSIATRGPAGNPSLVDTAVAKGNRWTSSYETEVTALLLAVEWLAKGSFGDTVVICSDSQAALSALSGSGKDDDSGIARLRIGLSRLSSRVILQWVPGHCGLIGNDWADSAAGEASKSTDLLPATTGGITFQSAKALIGREISDPALTHLRTKAVYDCVRDRSPLNRPDTVFIAQLRSGHCRGLAAYRSIVDSSASPRCPHCDMDVETVEHWLQ